MATPSKIPVFVPDDSIHGKAVLRALLGDSEFTKANPPDTAKIALLVDDCPGDPEHDPVIEGLLGKLGSSTAAAHPIPLILTPRADKLAAVDYRIPQAHILETASAGKLTKPLRERVRSLANWCNGHVSEPRCVTRSNLHDWIVDHIRRLLKLEVDSHRPGDAAYVAISRLRNLLESTTSPPESANGEKEFDALGKLRDSVRHLCNAMSPSTLLCEVLCPTTRALAQLPASWDEFLKNKANKELLDRIEGAFPRRSGVAFLTGLATRMRALVIDDDLAKPETAATLLTSLSETPLGGSNSKLGDFIEFFGLPVLANDSLNLERFLRADEAVSILASNGSSAAALPPDAFDFFLVDLSFGEKPGEEPFGYEVIWKLKRVCPGTPVLVHSAFGQRSHVIRAVQHGADWYCRKGEASRLIDHLASHVMAPRWTLSAPEADKVILPPGKKPEWPQDIRRKKFLYTRLLRDIPGDRLRITRFHGEGGAETARVEKELGSDLSRVSPTVVKIGRPDAVRMEQERYARFISPYLGNHVGRVDHRVVQAGALHAAIGYTFAGHGGGRSLGMESRVVSYADYLHRALRGGSGGAKPDTDQLIRPLEILLGEILPRIHDIQPEWDSTLPYPNPFFDEYDDPACSYLLRLPAEYRVEIADIREPDTGKALSDTGNLNKNQRIELPDACIVQVDLCPEGNAFRKLVLLQRIVRNGATHYRRFDAIPPPGDVVISTRRLRRLARIAVQGRVLESKENCWKHLSPKDKEIKKLDTVAACECFAGRIRAGHGRVGIIHGDLHFENVLLDASWSPMDGLKVEQSPWLIDFGRTRRDEIIHDFVVAEEFVVKEFLHSDLFAGRAGSQAITEFIESWLLSPWDRPACLRQEPTGRLEVVFHILSRIRKAASQAGVAGAFGDDKRYLSGLGLYLLWVLKRNLEEKKPDTHLTRVCAEAVKVIQKRVNEAC